jgi:AsmA protein
MRIDREIKSQMKKLFKLSLFAILAITVVLAAVATFLRIKYPPAKLKAMAQEYVKTHFNREISFGDLSFNLIGANLNDFALSEEGSFKNGTFISAKRLVVKVKLAPLFKKEIEVQTAGLEDLRINVIRQKNGRFNFDDLTRLVSAESARAPHARNAQAAAGVPAIGLMADEAYLKNADFRFSDKRAGRDFEVKKLNFKVKDFDFVDPFSFTLSLSTGVSLTGGVKISPVNFEAEGSVSLSDMNLEKASAAIKKIAVSYKTAKIALSGNIKNFKRSAINLKGKITGVDDKTFKDMADLPEFELPATTIDAAILSDSEKGYAEIKNISATSAGANITFSGKADYSGKDVKASGELKFSGLGAALNDISARDVGGTITIKSLDDISSDRIKGLLNGEKFETSLAYKKAGGALNADVFFRMDRLPLKDLNVDEFSKSFKTDSKDSSAKPAAPVEKDKPAQAGEPINLNADISVGKIENNVFSADNVALKVSLKNLDAQNRADGFLTFSSKNGEIKDFDKLTDAPVILRVILSSLKITNKAFAFLKMKAPSNAGGKGAVAYSRIDCAYTLSNGMVSLDKTEIDSDLATVKASGTINLVNEKLKMKLNVHLGKVGSGGFKPLVINVAGTVSDPSFKPDVASSLASLVEMPSGAVKGVANAVGTVGAAPFNGAAAAIKGIGGLFKKKK